MPQLPLLSGQRIIKILARIGYNPVRQRGSHIRLECPNRKAITVPNYKIIDRSLLRKIIRDADLTAEEFIEIYSQS